MDLRDGRTVSNGAAARHRHRRWTGPGGMTSEVEGPPARRRAQLDADADAGPTAGRPRTGPCALGIAASTVGGLASLWLMSAKSSAGQADALVDRISTITRPSDSRVAVTRTLVCWRGERRRVLQLLGQQVHEVGHGAAVDPRPRTPDSSTPRTAPPRRRRRAARRPAGPAGPSAAVRAPRRRGPGGLAALRPAYGWRGGPAGRGSSSWSGSASLFSRSVISSAGPRSATGCDATGW